MNMLLLLLTAVAALAACAAALCAWLALRRAALPARPPAELLEKLVLLEGAARQTPEQAASLRKEVVETILRLGEEQRGALTDFRNHMTASHAGAVDAFGRSSTELKEHQGDRLTELSRRMTDLSEKSERQHKEAREAQARELEKVTGKIGELTKANDERQEKLRETLTQNLETLRKENETKLEQMRATVDEKLQGTLDKRLGESFQLVSDRLDTVHKGLGEMQTLATGVGDLKRVLTNVKSRGSWGEVQLGALLDDMLTPDQYGRQIRLRPDSAEVVDFAVHLPGSSEDGRVLLPLDCKFPHEDYDRLLAAQDAGDPAAVELAAKGLERAVRLQAKSIREKYVHPPHTTPFAVMYLPTEGLFAEVVRRPGLMAELSANLDITVTGPTTLAALLNSLKMGFQTLRIQKNASDIMQTLGEAKKAFNDYGTALEAVDKKLDEAKKKVADVGVRHRAVHRKLRGVEALDGPGPLIEPAGSLLSMAGLPEEEDEAA